MKISIIRQVLVFILFLVSAGCTTVDTIEEYSGPEPLARPQVVIVKNFAYSPSHIDLNSGIIAKLERKVESRNPSVEELQLGRAVSNALVKKLVSKLSELGLDAQSFDPEMLPATDYLLIEGQLISIDQGNRARRIIIGLGFGESVVKTLCQVYDVSDSGRVLAQEFETVAHSSYKPGAAETMGIGAAVGVIGTAAATSAASDVVGETLGANVEEEAERTAKKLVEKMQPFFVEQGWILPE